MKIKESVRQRLDNNRGYGLIMYTLGCGASAARDYVKRNKLELTTHAVLEAIQKEFGLTRDEILEIADQEPVKG